MQAIGYITKTIAFVALSLALLAGDSFASSKNVIKTLAVSKESPNSPLSDDSSSDSSGIVNEGNKKLNAIRILDSSKESPNSPLSDDSSSDSSGIVNEGNKKLNAIRILDSSKESPKLSSERR